MLRVPDTAVVEREKCFRRYLYIHPRDIFSLSFQPLLYYETFAASVPGAVVLWAAVPVVSTSAWVLFVVHIQPFFFQ